MAVPNAADIARPRTMYVTWSRGTVRSSGCRNVSYALRMKLIRYIVNGEYMKNFGDIAASSGLAPQQIGRRQHEMLVDVEVIVRRPPRQAVEAERGAERRDGRKKQQSGPPAEIGLQLHG